ACAAPRIDGPWLPMGIARSRLPSRRLRHGPAVWSARPGWRPGKMTGMASDVRIGILGPLEVRVGFGEPVEVVGPRLRTLVVRLALDPDRVVLSGQLIDAVWGSAPPAQAANAL